MRAFVYVCRLCVCVCEGEREIVLKVEYTCVSVCICLLNEHEVSSLQRQQRNISGRTKNRLHSTHTHRLSALTHTHT